MASGSRAGEAAPAGRLEAGFVGRAHGLDGSFHVNVARARLLSLGGSVTVAGRTLEIVRLAGTDARPIVRLAGVQDRAGAEALRGEPLLVAVSEAPGLAPGEYWAHELEGCAVVDGTALVGEVRRLLELPSCEALEVARPDGRELIVPMVREAVREIDVAGRRVEVDLRFLGEAPEPGPNAPAPRGPRSQRKQP